MSIISGLTPVVLAGGSGSRLSPLSTVDLPKQFLPLTHQQLSMMQMAFERARRLSPVYAVVGLERHHNLIANEIHLARGGVCEPIFESEARNTAAAFGLVANTFLQREHDPVLVFMPSDHYWGDHGLGLDAILRLVARVRHGQFAIGVLGMKPTGNALGYGHFLPRFRDRRCKSGHVGGFVEKPKTVELANRLVSDGALWNMGVYVARATTIQRALARNDRDATGMSFDYAVAERYPHGSLGPMLYEQVDGVWSDLGSWDALQEHWMHSEMQPKVNRPWGYYRTLWERPGILVKEIVVQPGEQLSVQYHKKRSEDWRVMHGVAHVELGGSSRTKHHLETEQEIHIDVGQEHCLANHGPDMLRLIEVQRGEPDEDDIVRVADKYGRAAS